MAHKQDDLDTFVSQGILFSSATPCDRDSQSSPLHRISQCDLITFIAIAQSTEVRFVNIAWHQGLGSAGAGASANVQQALANASTSLAFKQLKQTDDESQMYKTALSEILVLQHPLIRAEENILDLYGVGWDVRKIEGTSDCQLVPVLVYENASRYGNLRSFMWKMRPSIDDVIGASRQGEGSLSFLELLKICEGIGKAVESMHACNVIHGDLKPDNILIFPGANGQSYVPKIIDFGYSTYGFSESDTVKIACTKEWAAPEWHHRAIEIQDAKKIDIYSFAKVCEWILSDSDIGFGRWQAMYRVEAKPHIMQFYHCGLCEDPCKRAGSISILLSMLRKARKAEGGSFFHDVLRMNAQGFESSLRDTLGQEEAVKYYMNVATVDSQQYSSDVKNLVDENHLETGDILSLLNRHLPRAIDIAKNFSDFQSIHFLIRVKIQERLLELSTKKQDMSETFNEIAFQLALCYELAFGIKINVEESRKWLKLSGHGTTRLSTELDKIRSSTRKSVDLRDLIDDSKALSNSDSYQEAGLLNNATEIFKIESEGKMASLGPHASATLSSQRDFAESLIAQGQYGEAKALLEHMLEMLEKEESYHYWQTALRLDLSHILAQQGDYPRAISMCEELLLQTESTSEIMFALSDYYGKVCEYERSAECIKKVWKNRQVKFGNRHPLTLSALELLSYAMTDVNLEEAERMEIEVLEWRRRVMGENHDIMIQTLENLAFVKGNITGKEKESIELQREVLSLLTHNIGSSFARLALSTNRMIWLQGNANQVNEAIKTGEQILDQKRELLKYPYGLALLGNHTGNLKAVGRDTEAEKLKLEILEKVPTVLKPIPRLSNGVVRGVARAFLLDGQFDKEASALYKKIWELRQKRREDLGKHDEGTAMLDRFLALLYSEGHIVQSAVHILGLEHTTTKLAITRMENRLSNFVKGETEVEACISEAIAWIRKRIASFHES